MMNTLLDLGGTLRTQTAQQTLAWVTPKFAQLGITRVANITGLDHLGLYCVTCIRPNSKHIAVSQGKGLSLELAKISAIMESIEGFHCEHPPPVKLQGSYHALKTQQPVLHPHQFPRTALGQATLLNQPLEWIACTHLMTQQRFYLPRILCALDTTHSQPAYAFFQVSTNGLAAGNTLSEALCHALFEIIERDALARWQSLPEKKQRDTRLDLHTLHDGNADLIARLTSADMRLKIWEITSKLGVPAYHCALFGQDVLRHLSLFTGTGAHLVKEIALSRAITEAAQSRVAIIAGNRDDLFPEIYHAMRRDALADNLTHVNNGTRDYHTCTTEPVGLEADNNLQHVLSLLQHHDYPDAFYVNLTRPDIAVPVVQVFVPGLQFNGVR